MVYLMSYWEAASDVYNMDHYNEECVHYDIIKIRIMYGNKEGVTNSSQHHEKCVHVHAHTHIHIT